VGNAVKLMGVIELQTVVFFERLTGLNTHLSIFLFEIMKSR